MRTGIFKEIITGDLARDRIQSAITIAVNQLAADHDLLSVPVSAMSVSGQIAPGKSVIVYAGLPGAVLSLPSAAAQGQNTAAIILVGNRSAGAITIQATGNDRFGTLPTFSLAAGAAAILTSDGINNWFAGQVGGTGTGPAGTPGAMGLPGHDGADGADSAIPGPIGPPGPQGPIGLAPLLGTLANGYIASQSGQTTTSATFVDVPGMSTTVTLSQLSDIVAWSSFEWDSTGAGLLATAGWRIQISSDNGQQNNDGSTVTLVSQIGSVMHRTGTLLPAGTYTVKLQFLRQAGTQTVSFVAGELFAMALVGPRGDAGPAGLPGLDGQDGEDGVPGLRGPSGIQGQLGPQGPDGQDGQDGADSIVPGPRGQAGIQGPQGVAGQDGESGEAGWMPGPPGPPGPAGAGSGGVPLAPAAGLALASMFSLVSVRSFLVVSGQKLSIGAGARFRIL